MSKIKIYFCDDCNAMHEYGRHITLSLDEILGSQDYICFCQLRDPQCRDRAKQAIERLIAEAVLTELQSLKINPYAAVEIEGHRQLLEEPMIPLSQIDNRIAELSGNHPKP